MMNVVEAIEFSDSDTAWDAKQILNSTPAFKYKMAKQGPYLGFASKAGEKMARRILRDNGMKGI